MAQKDLALVVTIKHKGKVIWEADVEINDDILDLTREREFGLTHQIERVGIQAVKGALKNYDTSKWEK